MENNEKQTQSLRDTFRATIRGRVFKAGPGWVCVESHGIEGSSILLSLRTINKDYLLTPGKSYEFIIKGNLYFSRKNNRYQLGMDVIEKPTEIATPWDD